MKKMYLTAGATVMLAIVGGCDTSDERAVRLASESAERQAQQNQVISDLGREMADNQRRIVEAVASSRSELVSLQNDVAKQRQQLDVERKAIAGERRTESFLGAIVGPGGWIALAALPLVLCWLILCDLRSARSEDDAICQLLVDEILPDTVNKLPATEANCRRLNHEPAADSDQSPSELPF